MIEAMPVIHVETFPTPPPPPPQHPRAVCIATWEMTTRRSPLSISGLHNAPTRTRSCVRGHTWGGGDEGRDAHTSRSLIPTFCFCWPNFFAAFFHAIEAKFWFYICCNKVTKLFNRIFSFFWQTLDIASRVVCLDIAGELTIKTIRKRVSMFVESCVNW